MTVPPADSHVGAEDNIVSTCSVPLSPARVLDGVHSWLLLAVALLLRLCKGDLTQ